MTGALYTASDYAAALSALRPRGRVWPTESSSVQQQVLGVLAPTAERLDAAAQGLLIDSFPATAVSLLPEWEESLGLDQAEDSTAQRQANVVAQLIAVGGQSKADFIAFAAERGFTIAIQTYAPFRCGIGMCGQALQGTTWCFAWSIEVQVNTGAMTNAELLTAIQAIAPAETTVFLTT
jgi:uncharacterized protein YmfQ (DUF2313 family)